MPIDGWACTACGMSAGATPMPRAIGSALPTTCWRSSTWPSRPTPRSSAAGGCPACTLLAVRAARGRAFCPARTAKDGRPASEPPARDPIKRCLGGTGRADVRDRRQRRLERFHPDWKRSGLFSEHFHIAGSRRDPSQSEDDLIGRALHQHKLHFSEVYGLRRDQSGRIFLKNDRLVFHEGE